MTPQGDYRCPSVYLSYLSGHANKVHLPPVWGPAFAELESSVNQLHALDMPSIKDLRGAVTKPSKVIGRECGICERSDRLDQGEA